MCRADIGDDAMCRHCCSTEGGYLSHVVGTHLHHRECCIIRCAEQGQRNTYVIVEVATGAVYPSVPRQNGGDQLHGGCLAVGAGYTDDGHMQPLPVTGGQCCHGLKDIVNNNYFFSAERPVIHYGGQRSGLGAAAAYLFPSWEGPLSAKKSSPLFTALESVVTPAEPRNRPYNLSISILF